MLLAITDDEKLVLVNREKIRTCKYVTSYSIDKGLLCDVKSHMTLEYICGRQGLKVRSLQEGPSTPRPRA
ncbi:hypothetical protein Tco_0043033, partial [Tanacetum coccineum]